MQTQQQPTTPARPVKIEVPLNKSPSKPDIAVRLESQHVDPAAAIQHGEERVRMATQRQQEILAERKSKAEQESEKAAQIAAQRHKEEEDQRAAELARQKQRIDEASARAAQNVEQRKTKGQQEVEKVAARAGEIRTRVDEATVQAREGLDQSLDQGRERREKAEQERLAKAAREAKKVEEARERRAHAPPASATNPTD
ncbi:hypothetical protein PAPYR_3091 [Paratrimastix pyriformis]|uniref:Uncharacterized protein n=1 Tax=Paratrimastix pyriformis TaxID=342808 RepID=A0ABQ8UR82_9EUKA|nr:hypothetical protein PAPYR_3091 [Paratrimastix pyriformis]|eukprot:GAFH01004270.1.p3 GENE.GAFH01004270.1~~GAFH01004270.1.p3  ORF type:complete len:199 (-),score=45.05 GAFH01004270.1:167-763(-)